MAGDGFKVADIYADLEIDTDSAVSKASARLRASGSVFTKAGKTFGDNVSDSYSRSTRQMERETDKVARRVQAKYHALTFAGAFAGLPAAAAVAGTATVGALAGVPAAFAAIAVAGVKSRADVKAAWEGTGEFLQSELEDWAAPLADDFIDAAFKVRQAANDLSPQIAAAFQHSQAAVGLLTDSVIVLAKNAMPGLVVAAQNSIAPLLGVRQAAGEVGHGITEMFVNLSAGAAASQGILVTTGGIIRDLLGFTGQLFANLTISGGPALAQFRVALQQVQATLLTLTSQGSAVFAFFGGFLQSTSGMLTVIQGLASAISALPAPVAQFGGALTATAMIASRFGLDVGAGFTGITQRINEASTAGGKLRAGFAGLAAGVFNPTTLAIAGVAAVLMILGNRQQEAAAAAQAHKDRVQRLSDALRESGGVITSNVRQMAAQELAAYKVGDGTRNLTRDVQQLAGAQGVALLTEAYLGNKAAGDQLLAMMDATPKSMPVDDYRTLTSIVGGLSGQFMESVNAQDALQQAAWGVNAAHTAQGRAALLAESGSSTLTTAIKALEDVTTDADEAASSLVTVLDRLNGRTPSYEEAVQSMNDTIRDLRDNFANGASDVDGWGAALLNADGTVNTATKNGSYLQDSLVTLQRGFADAAASINELTKTGMDYGAASEMVRGQLRQQYDAFVQAARGAGLTEDQIKRLAQAYGLTPDLVVTEFQTPGATAAQQAAGLIRDKILQIPNPTTIVTTALTQDAITQLQALGFTVQQMPDGTVRITANTQPAKDMVSQLLIDTNVKNATVTVFGNNLPAIGAVQNWANVTTQTSATTTTYTYTDPATGAVTQWTMNTNGTGATTTTYSNPDPAYGAVGTWKKNADGTWATATLDVNTGPAYEKYNALIGEITKPLTIPLQTQLPPGLGLPAYNATGNLLAPMASGGQLTPMSGSRATVVPPNTWRVIGDNMRHKEAFIPINGTPRSQSILASTAQEMGYQLMPMAGGGLASATSGGGLQAAAREIYNRIMNGNHWFEDYTYYGASENLQRYNDQLVKMTGGNWRGLSRIMSSGVASSSGGPATGGGFSNKEIAMSIANHIGQVMRALFEQGMRVQFDVATMERGLIRLNKERAAR